VAAEISKKCNRTTCGRQKIAEIDLLGFQANYPVGFNSSGTQNREGRIGRQDANALSVLLQQRKPGLKAGSGTADNHRIGTPLWPMGRVELGL
jgi:hypothetical protein